MILLLSAVAQENTYLCAQLFNPATCTCGPFEYQRGTLGAHSVAIATCGIGMANAAAVSALLLEHLKPEALVMCGCAGAYPPGGLNPGDLALAEGEIYADTGAVTPEGFLSMRALNLPLFSCKDTHLYNRFPASEHLKTHAAQILTLFAQQNSCAFAAGDFATVAACSGTDRRAEALHCATHAICENMEGAAVAHMCTMFGVPFLEIRAVSNMAENRDIRSWILDKAMQRAQEALLFWLRHTTPQFFILQEEPCHTP
jgi:futalosine hydrolase